MKALAAEVTANFGKRLAPLGLVVKELTGNHLLVVILHLLYFFRCYIASQPVDFRACQVPATKI